MSAFILRFPMDNRPLLLEWLKAIGYDETFKVTQNTLICSAHFEITDYVLENGSYEISTTAIPKLKYETQIIDRPVRFKTPIIVEVRGGYHPKIGYVNSAGSNCNENESANITNMIESSIETSLNNIGSNQCQNDNVEISDQNDNVEVLDQNDNVEVSDQNDNVKVSDQNDNIEVLYQNELSPKINSSLVNNGASVSSIDSPSPALNSTNRSQRNGNLRQMNHKYLFLNNVNKNRNNCANTSYMHSPKHKLNVTNKSKYRVNNVCSTRKSLLNTRLSARQKHKWLYMWTSVIKPSTKCICPLLRKNCKKLTQTRIQNRTLNTKIKRLTTRKRDVLDFKLKYLELKAKLLETEEQLLNCGVNTNKYSVFHISTDSHEIPKNVDYDVLLECKLDEMNESSTNCGITLQSVEFPTAVQTSPENESEHY